MPILKHRKLWLTIPTLLFLLALCFALPAQSAGPLYTRAERIGIAFVSEVPQGSGYVHQSLHEYNMARLRVGWYSDWRYAATPDQPADTTLDYIQLINVRPIDWPPDWSAVRNAVEHNPGATWIIGNEPECPNQGDRTPEEYARIYKEAFERVKGWDPTARIAIGGIVEPTRLRFRWLEATLSKYQELFGEAMPVDVWNIHMQILREWDPATPGDLKAGAGIPVGISWAPEEAADWGWPLCANPQFFESMVMDFRQWMKDHGQGDKELIISEMGVLPPSDYLVEGDYPFAKKVEMGNLLIEQFMTTTFNWLLDTKDPAIGLASDEGRLVQRWLWFSLNGSFFDDNNTGGFNGSLYDYQTKNLTRFGNRFIDIQNPYRLSLPITVR